MHGVKRQPKTAATADARAARNAKEAAKLHAYLEIEHTFFTHKRESRKDVAALEHTTKLLTLNPELYTVWNYRRQILLHIFVSELEEERKEQNPPDVFASLRIAEHPEREKDTAQVDVEEKRRTQRNQALLEDDLMLTEHALRAHPKVYWIWNHRMWCLTQYPPPSSSTSAYGGDSQWVWERELKLVETMLDYDPRNFHGWNCRRAIVEHIALSILSSQPSTAEFAATGPSFPALLSHPLVIASANEQQAKSRLLALAERELAYALKKIETNFSNFSAWHQRTKLLPHLWAAQQLTTVQIDRNIDSELELVKQAMYTDPADQSAWFYHRWLIEQLSPTATQLHHSTGTPRQIRVLQHEIATIEELFQLEPDSKWCAISLAHYHTLLVALFPQQDVDKRDESMRQARRLLEQLIELDPDREARYRDLLQGKAHF